MATYTWEGSLAGGDSTTIDISFTVDDYVLGTLVNWAEISVDDGAVFGGDIDSTPDANDANDEFVGDLAVADETPAGSTDNTTDGDGSEDEDDHDPAVITIDPYYDLALVKTLQTT